MLGILMYYHRMTALASDVQPIAFRRSGEGACELIDLYPFNIECMNECECLCSCPLSFFVLLAGSFPEFDECTALEINLVPTKIWKEYSGQWNVPVIIFYDFNIVRWNVSVCWTGLVGVVVNKCQRGIRSSITKALANFEQIFRTLKFGRAKNLPVAQSKSNGPSLAPYFFRYALVSVWCLRREWSRKWSVAVISGGSSIVR